MNYFHRPQHPVLLFLGCLGIGLLAFIVCSMVVIITQIGASPSSFSLDILPRNVLISIQVIQMVTLFVLPPVLFALFSKNDFIRLFSLNKPVIAQKYVFATLFAICLYPVMINFVDLVKQIPLPENIRLQAEEGDKLLEAAMKLLLDSKSFINFIIMLLIVGVGAGLTEELFFRGLLMPLIGEKTGSIWSAIIISAVLFSSLHGSIYNFIPIVLVGIMFGALYYKTQDLKLNIYIHALFNGLQVILNYLSQIEIIPVDIEEMDRFPIYIAIPCLILSIFLFQNIYKSDEYISS